MPVSTWQPRYPPPRIKPWGHIWRYLLALVPWVLILVSMSSIGSLTEMQGTDPQVTQGVTLPTTGPSNLPATIGPGSLPATTGPGSLPATIGPSSLPPATTPSGPISTAATTLPTPVETFDLSPADKAALNAQLVEARGKQIVDLTLGAIALVLMAFRRRWPITVNAVMVPMLLWSQSMQGAWSIAFISLATRRRWREVIPIGAASFAASYYKAFGSPDTFGVVGWPWMLASVAFVLVVIVAVGAIGFYIGTNRELLSSLKDEVASAETERLRLAERAQQQERARIAREMHDVLAHRISVIAMHAGAMEYREDLSPAESRDSAGVIRDYAHQALTDLRGILGVLRATPVDGSSPVDGAPEPPQPTLADLPALVRECESGGMSVDLDDEVPAVADVPPTVGRSAYRIVQEALTNARKHAPGTRVRVALSGMPGGDLLVRITNPLSRQPSAAGSAIPGSGLGLVGLRERAVLTGGTLDHWITPGGDFELEARMPWPSVAESAGL